ncbi:hypothetical protein EDB86DRAFT_2974006 [Lactarius hatsudake]|nr:hypothetical protein EDB86DRAFT_2974006 [Lactarius hatsudake]
MLNGFILFIPFSCASCAMLSPLGIPASPGEPSPRLNPPTPIQRPASATCRSAAAIALLPSSLPQKRSDVFERAGLSSPDQSHLGRSRHQARGNAG